MMARESSAKEDTVDISFDAILAKVRFLQLSPLNSGVISDLFANLQMNDYIDNPGVDQEVWVAYNNILRQKVLFPIRKSAMAEHTPRLCNNRWL
jgi:hypothetical protein